MDPGEDVLLRKARTALAGAESELAAGRHENVANRSYYACFQAAVAALEADGVRPPVGSDGRWSHSAVQAQFNGLLINRRKRFDADLRQILGSLGSLRQRADYTKEAITATEAKRALRSARQFIAAVESRRSR
jgi:uncharacterized protein (UPF0332 family)